jgi:dolichol-phosphate mannosyltransferase
MFWLLMMVRLMEPRTLCECMGLKLLREKVSMVSGSAYRTGFSIAIQRGYTYVIEMDADGSHQIVDLKNMMEWIGSSDVLIGSRWVPDGAIANWSKFRVYLSRTANTYANIMLSLGIKDTTSGFRIYSADILKKMRYFNYPK